MKRASDEGMVLRERYLYVKNCYDNELRDETDMELLFTLEN